MIVHRACFRGNTLSEYGLIAALCLLGVLPGLLLVGDAVKGLFHGILPDTSQTQVVSLPIQAQGMPPGQQVDSVSGTFSPDMSIDMKSVLTQPLSETIQTVGVNGTSKVLADAVILAADKALADGKITEEQHAGLIQLANEGHKIAEIQALIEGVANAEANRDDRLDANMVGATVSYEGKNVLFFDLWVKLQMREQTEGTSLLNSTVDPQVASLSQVQKFIDRYQELSQSGALNDPALKQVISSLSENILQLNKSLDTTVLDIQYERATATNMLEVAASKLTNDDSTVICKEGKASDTGTFCSAALTSKQ